MVRFIRLGEIGSTHLAFSPILRCLPADLIYFLFIFHFRFTSAPRVKSVVMSSGRERKTNVEYEAAASRAPPCPTKTGVFLKKEEFGSCIHTWHINSSIFPPLDGAKPHWTFKITSRTPRRDDHWLCFLSQMRTKHPATERPDSLHKITFIKIDQRNPTTLLWLSNYIFPTANEITLQIA